MKNRVFSLDKYDFLSYNSFQAVKSATIEYIRGAVRISLSDAKEMQTAEMGSLPNPFNLFG